jgi:hypothetical protein
MHLTPLLALVLAGYRGWLGGNNFGGSDVVLLFSANAGRNRLSSGESHAGRVGASQTQSAGSRTRGAWDRCLGRPGRSLRWPAAVSFLES